MNKKIIFGSLGMGLVWSLLAWGVTNVVTRLQTDTVFMGNKGNGNVVKQLIFETGQGSSNPVIQWNNSLSQLQYSNNGSLFSSFNSTAIAPTFSTATATGTGTGGFGNTVTGWMFTLTSTGNATVGTTYTNNGNTYTVQQTIAAGSTLFASGGSSPLGSGTLTKTGGGAGDSTISYTLSTATATYTPPSGVVWFKLTQVGAGGGGASSNNPSTTGNASSGTASVFGFNYVLTNGGTRGTGGNGDTGGAGGSASYTSPAYGECFAGAYGVAAPMSQPYQSGNIGSAGGAGGATPFSGGGAPGGGGGGSPGINAAANSGAGGGGGGIGATASGSAAGGGGGAGGFCHVYFSGSLAASYVYIVGSQGSGGSTSTGAIGGNGAYGKLTAEEHYNY